MERRIGKSIAILLLFSGFETASQFASSDTKQQDSFFTAGSVPNISNISSRY